MEIEDLPKGWADEYLDFCAPLVKTGVKEFKGKKLYYSTGSINEKSEIPEGLFSFAERPSRANRMGVLGDILQARMANTNKPLQIDEKLNNQLFSTGFLQLRTKSAILFNKHLFYFLKSFYFLSQKDEYASGSTQVSLNDAGFKKIKIPVPPHPEQKRIVAKLDQIFPLITNCQNNLEDVLEILRKFKKAVLFSACVGDLTEDFRNKNKLNDSSFLIIEIEKIKKSLKIKDCKKARTSDSFNFELPNTWSLPRLEDLCLKVTDGTHKTPKYQQSGVKFLSVKNVRPFRIFDKSIKFISKPEHEWINSRCNPEKGDILYTKVGATFGYAAINDLDYPFSIFVSLALIKPVQKYFLSKYAEIVMNSEIVFSQARERVSGIGTPDLHLIEIRDFKIPFPPIEEQIEIVRRVETLLVLADQIEAQYLVAKAQVDNLAQSVLAKAFRGELVPQDSSDEPASVLLERIKKENTNRKHK